MVPSSARRFFPPPAASTAAPQHAMLGDKGAVPMTSCQKRQTGRSRARQSSAADPRRGRATSSNLAGSAENSFQEAVKTRCIATASSRSMSGPRRIPGRSPGPLPRPDTGNRRGRSGPWSRAPQMIEAKARRPSAISPTAQLAIFIDFGIDAGDIACRLLARSRPRSPDVGLPPVEHGDGVGLLRRRGERHHARQSRQRAAARRGPAPISRGCSSSGDFFVLKSAKRLHTGRCRRR